MRQRGDVLEPTSRSCTWAAICGLGTAVKRAQMCAMCTWELGPSIGGICCALAGHQKKEVGEQDLLLRGETIHPWKRRALNVLLRSHGFGLFQDMVTYMPFVIQLPPSPQKKKKGSSKRSVFVTTDNMYKVVNGK